MMKKRKKKLKKSVPMEVKYASYVDGCAMPHYEAKAIRRAPYFKMQQVDFAKLKA